MKGSIGVAYLMAGLIGMLGHNPSLWADDSARFDLEGPKVDVRVQRGSVTLPIAQVPNLLAGDQDIREGGLAFYPVQPPAAGCVIPTRHHQRTSG